MNAVFNAQSFIKESTLSLHVENTSQWAYESYFLEGLNFLSQLRKEKTVQEAKLYKVMAEAGDNLWVVHEGFGDFFQWVKDFIKKVINFFKKILAKFWMRINSLFGRDKYIENHKDQLHEFGSEHEFDIKGYKFTIQDGIPKLDPVENVEEALHGLAKAVENNGVKTYEIKKADNLKAEYIRFQEDKEDLDKERAAILGEHGKIASSDWKDSLFEKFRDGDRQKTTITVTSSVVTESLTNFTNHDKLKSKTEKQRDDIEKAYNRIQKRFDQLAEKAKNLAGKDAVSVSDFVDTEMGAKADEDKIFTISAFARDISNRLEEISNLHVMAFTAKLDAIKDRYHQDKAILYGAFKKILAKKSMWSTESAVLESYQDLLETPVAITEVAEIDTQNLEGITGPLTSKMNNGDFLAGNDHGGKYQPTYQDSDVLPEMKDPNKLGGIPANLDPYMREKYYKSTSCCCEGNRLDLVEDLSYSTYMLECVVESEKLRGFANLLIGVHEGASVEKLEIIQEGVTDKIKNIWEKFKSFLNKVWEKFKNYMFRLVDNNVQYLERYKDIILNRKPNEYTFNMENYAEGIKRIQTVTIAPFVASRNNISPDDENGANYKKSLLDKKYTDDEDWNKYCTSYFQGGDDTIQYNLQEMNMTSLYNYCHDWKSTILPSITKDQNTLQTNINAIQKEIDNLDKAEADAAKQQAEAKAAVDKQKADANAAEASSTPAQPQATKPSKFKVGDDNWGGTIVKVDPATAGKFDYTVEYQNGSRVKKVNQEAAILTPELRAYGEMVIDRYFNETISNASSGNADTSNGTRPGTNATSRNTAVTSRTANKVGKINSLAGEKEEQRALGDGASKAQAENLSKQLTIYNQAAAGILTGKFTAAQNMYRDYMTLIKHHVAEQVGKTGDDRVAAADNTGAKPAQQPEQANPQPQPQQAPAQT